MRKIVFAAVAVGAIAMTTAMAVATRAGASPPEDLQAAKAASARYHSLEQALKDGYSGAGEPCVASPDGAMGIHYVNGPLTRDLAIDPQQPEILLYIPGEDGALKLIGVEYFVVALANTPEGPRPWFGSESPPLGFFNPAPTLFGQTFDGPMEGHNPEMPWHYDLHVWVAEENPSGVFAMFNPALSC